MEGNIMNHNRAYKRSLTSFEAPPLIKLASQLLVVCLLSYAAFAHSNGGQNGGKVRRLWFTVKTGDDDLRGGNDNLNVGIYFRDGKVQWARNVNKFQRWPDNTTQMFDIALDRPAALSEIASIDFQKETGVGFGGSTDEWHMASVSVRATGDNIDKIIATHGYTKFTVIEQELLIPVTMTAPGKANKLELIIKTGGDDLRGEDELSVTIHYRGGHQQIAKNITGGKAFANGSTNLETITLDQAVDPSDIAEVDLATYTATTGLYKDNWDMDSISIRATGEGVDKIIAKHGFNRFTGSRSSLSIPVTLAVAGKANKLELAIQTGGDDLRGDNDNFNVVIHFSGNRTQVAKNVNGGKPWHNDSTHVESITLDHAVDPSDIVEVDLQTTFAGGTGGDNWDMNSVTVKAIGEGVNEVIFRGGPKRFTGDSRIFRLKKGQ
jgi:hypothetical protein